MFPAAARREGKSAQRGRLRFMRARSTLGAMMASIPATTVARVMKLMALIGRSPVLFLVREAVAPEWITSPQGRRSPAANFACAVNRTSPAPVKSQTGVHLAAPATLRASAAAVHAVLA